MAERASARWAWAAWPTWLKIIAAKLEEERERICALHMGFLITIHSKWMYSGSHDTKQTFH